MNSLDARAAAAIVRINRKEKVAGRSLAGYRSEEATQSLPLFCNTQKEKSRFEIFFVSNFFHLKFWPPTECDSEGALWSGINTIAATFYSAAAVNLEPGSDFCFASKTQSPLPHGFHCLD